jgi:hypothetical protein
MLRGIVHPDLGFSASTQQLEELELEQLEGGKARRDTSPSRDVCELMLRRLCEFFQLLISSVDVKVTLNMAGDNFTRDHWLTQAFRLKQAAADPSALSQETIISNLDEVERGRLARIRNIGIAVSNI